MSEDIDSLKEAEKDQLHEAASAHNDNHATRTRRRQHDRGDNNWVAGVVLIAIGAIFLFTNVTGFRLDNWWALFILIPALSSFGKAWQSYQRDGRLSHNARGSLTGGFILSLVASAFLFNLDWGLIWPMFLIIGGISALLGGWFD